MLCNVDIVSPLLSSTWNQSLNLLSRAKLFKVCPAHRKKMKRTEHQQLDFQKQRVYQKPTQQ
jgi:hypothetical protein